MGIAKGAEKEEANLLDMAPLSALYVRHIISHSARPLLCFHLLGRKVTSCQGQVIQALQQELFSSSLLATDQEDKIRKHYFLTYPKCIIVIYYRRIYSSSENTCTHVYFNQETFFHYSCGLKKNLIQTVGNISHLIWSKFTILSFRDPI